MKIVSFNICVGDDPEARMPLLKEVLERYDADIMGIQEVREPYWREFFEREFCDRYEMHLQYRKHNNQEGTPVLWKKDKFDCIDKGHFWFSDTPDVESGGWDDYAGCYRIVSWAKLREKASGKVFTYINTHYGFGNENQIKYGKLLFERMDMIDSGPTLLSADFNMFDTSDGYKVLTERFIDVNKATDNFGGPTYHGFDPETFKNGTPIDFIFATPDIQPITCKKITDQVDGKYPSDHFGVYAEVEIK